jgi:hypothetical protein
VFRHWLQHRLFHQMGRAEFNTVDARLGLGLAEAGEQGVQSLLLQHRLFHQTSRAEYDTVDAPPAAAAQGTAGSCTGCHRPLALVPSRCLMVLRRHRTSPLPLVGWAFSEACLPHFLDARLGLAARPGGAAARGLKL